jgi:hypothetical protein
MKLQDIDNLQEKCDYLQNCLINAKEKAIESGTNDSGEESDAVIKGAIINISNEL